MIKEAIVKIVNKQDLTYAEAYAVMNEIMDGATTPTQNAAFLAALEETLPPCLAVTARADDGEIMAVAHRTPPIYGLQFHPESILTPQGPRILRNFLTLARHFHP